MLVRRLALCGSGLVSVMALLWVGCATHEDVWKDKGGPPRVVVTFPPLVSFVKSVGGDHVGVICLCTTTGPHDYQYNATEIIGLRHADLFLANGLGLDDSFADNLKLNVNRPKLDYVKLGDDLPKDLLKPADHAEDKPEEKAGGDHKHQHKHGEYDPHIWLGIPQAKKMVERTRDALKKVDPNHAKEYDSNTEEYLTKLDALKKKGRELLAGKKIKLVSFHDSLRYFADTYGVEIVDVIEGGPGETPGGPKMADLVKLCVKEKIDYIAVEPQYPKSTSASILMKALEEKKRTVKLIEIDPLETVEPAELADLFKDGGWYERKMEENLKSLAEADKK